MGPEDQIDFYDDYIQHHADEAFPKGLLVAYQPSEGGPLYAGRVASRPRKMEDGDWVVRLDDMQPSYSEMKGCSHTVIAASLSRLRHIQEKPTAGSASRGRDPMELVQAVVDRWDLIERTGTACDFNGCGMIYASQLEDLNDLALAIAESYRPARNELPTN